MRARTIHRLQPPPPRLTNITFLRTLTTTVPISATPLPGVASPGPPPKPPQISPKSDANERLARARRKVELLELGKSLRAAEKAPASPSTQPSTRRTLPKRFWKSVTVGPSSSDGHYLEVRLDGRPVRTTKDRRILRIPRSKPHLATGVALEWESLESTQQALKGAYIPLTDLTSRALDIEEDDAGQGPGGQSGRGQLRERVVEMFMSYLSTDTLLCWAPSPSPLTPESQPTSSTDDPTLREIQIATATPIISYLTTHIWPGIELNPVLEENSISPIPQPEMTQNVIRGWVTGLPAFELAGLERAVLAGKSACVAARLVGEWSAGLNDGLNNGTEEKESQGQDTERFGIEEAAKACSLEVSWQTGMWGEVEDTHDVDKEDMRRQLGSVILLVGGAGGGLGRGS